MESSSEGPSWDLALPSGASAPVPASLQQEEVEKTPQDLVDARLDNAQQALLAGLVLQEDRDWADNPEQIFADCRKAVANAVLKQRLQVVNRLLEEARMNSDEGAEIKYLQEFTEINQKLKKKL